MGKKIEEIRRRLYMETDNPTVVWHKTAEELERLMEEQGAVIAEQKRGITALEVQAEYYMAEIARLRKENEDLTRGIHAVDEMNAQLAAKVEVLKRKLLNG